MKGSLSLRIFLVFNVRELHVAFSSNHIYFRYSLLGRPDLNSSLSRLSVACLQENEDFLLRELEPLDLCDLLFEEKAIEILAHDMITESSQRQKQTTYLIDTLKENNNDCFHFFLYTLQRTEYANIREEFEKPASEAIKDGMIYSIIKTMLICIFG